MADDARIAFTAAHGYGDADFAAAVWGMVTPRVARHGKPAFLQEHGASWKGPLQHALDPAGLGSHNAAWASAVGIGAGTGMAWWWNEVDALDTYGRLRGAAAFVRGALGGRLLAYAWTTWGNNSAAPGCAHARAGWMVGTDDAGVARAAAFFVYNKNHTWGAQNAGAPLFEIAGCNTTLRALNARAPARVTWYDTETGLPTTADSDGAAKAGQPVDKTTGLLDLVFAAPTFTTDVAALALMED